MSRLEYTEKDLVALTNQELDFFNQNGFVGPFKLYEPDEAKQLLQEIRIKNIDRSRILFDNDVNYDRHFDILELTRHVSHPGIVGRVRSIIGNDLLSWRTEFFPKFPGSKATEWHQVAKYQYATGKPMLEPTQEIPGVPIDLTVWTTFTDATKENGCMRFLPGTHNKLYYDESKSIKRGDFSQYKSVESETSFFGYDFEEFKVDPNWLPEQEQAVDMEMKPGECVIFTAKCVHASYPNTTKRSTRFAIASRYVATHVKVYPDQKKFFAHGGNFDLENYGCVLVSGQDAFHHNTLRTENNYGEKFLKY